jgi:Ca2+-binding RTX toxin-like protein
MGYDTAGLRRVIEGSSANALLDGIYLDDLDLRTKRDVFEIRFKGKVSAAAAVDVVVASAGVEGGIELTVEMDLDDRPNPDGKLRIQEIEDKLANPWCLFVISGKLEAYLSAFVKIDLIFKTKKWERGLARVTLLDFEKACEPEAPTLVDFDDMNHDTYDDLVIKIGGHSPGRNLFDDEADETVVVRQLEPLVDGKETRVSVSMFNVVVTTAVPINGVIWVDAADGNDRITFEPGVEYTATSASAVTTTAKIIHFTLPITVYGGTGNDFIRTGEGDDHIYGDGYAPNSSGARNAEDTNDDTLVGGGGDDHIEGGRGNDRLDGGRGVDALLGGTQDDSLHGGPNNDTLFGEMGDDNLTGGALSTRELGEEVSGPEREDADLLFGDYPGYPRLIMITFGFTSGDDAIVGGFGEDVIIGDWIENHNPDDKVCIDRTVPLRSAGDDTVDPGEGDDRVFLGGGVDEVVDSPGNDWICKYATERIGSGTVDQGFTVVHGGEGDDTLYGSEGREQYFGDEGNDYIETRGGNDELFGGDGYDQLIGGDGRDRLYGENQQDFLIGDDGTIAGKITAVVTMPRAWTIAHSWVEPSDEGASGEIVCNRHADSTSGNADCLDGGQDQDFAYGGGGHDFIFGDHGQDFLFGNSGNDTIRGESEGDIIYGNPGDDQLYGDSGEDYVEGNEDDDDIFGGKENDDLIGGTSQAEKDDGGDEMEGNGGEDLLLGDNGCLIRVAGVRACKAGANIPNKWLFDLDTGNLDRAWAGDDFIHGNGNHDQIFGGGEDDTIWGEADVDFLQGNGGDDTIEGGEGQDDILGGSSQGQGNAPDGADIIEGGNEQDVIVGDNGLIERPPGGGSDPVDSTMLRTVTLYNLNVGNGDDELVGGDTIHGDNANDDIYGGGADDTIHGDAGDDYIEGNGAGDTIYGDLGQDDIMGGTAQELGGTPDGGDTLWGGDGSGDLEADFDVIIGDNGLITRPTSQQGQWILDSFSDEASNIVRRRTVLFDVATVDFAPRAVAAGGDKIYGEASYDLLYGQGDNDFLHGGGGDDHIEGNAANDHLWGDDGQDDLIGGSGRTISDDPASAMNDRLDGADTMYGHSGEIIHGEEPLCEVLVDNSSDDRASGDQDVLVGDNATITRPLDEAERWQINTFHSGVVRYVWFFDVATIRYRPDSRTSGDDTIYGQFQEDWLYGQGANDTLSGGSADDLLEGNAGNDKIAGDKGNDDLLGGTGRINNDPETSLPNRLDGDDWMAGGEGYDFMAGDNAVISRTLQAGRWVRNTYNEGVQHQRIWLQDLDSENMAWVSGDDRLCGYGDDDVLYGQAKGDVMHGGAGHDYLEGNAGDDLMTGGVGQDDMIGGTGRINNDPRVGTSGRLDGSDAMWGDGERLPANMAAFYDENQNPVAAETRTTCTTGGALRVVNGNADVILGDNGIIDRPLVRFCGKEGLWQLASADGAFVRQVRLFELTRAGALLPRDDTQGRDKLWGNHGNDLLLGQGLSDALYGGRGDDHIEGNSGRDYLYGGDGEDDMLGGSSSGDGIFASGVAPLMVADEEDWLYGNGDDDLILGDNGIIRRPTDRLGFWLFLRDGFFETVSREVEWANNEPLGTIGRDTIEGNAGNDFIAGNGGDDLISGNGGYDLLYGNDGNDRLEGNDGRDRLVGNGGDDRLTGNAGDDCLQGDAGMDTLFGWNGDDLLWDLTGGDTAPGAHSDNQIAGSECVEP